MKKLIVLLLLCSVIPAFSNANTGAMAKNDALFVQQVPPFHLLGYWYEFSDGHTYHIYVYDADPTSIAKIQQDDGSVEDATGTYDEEYGLAEVFSSLGNFTAWITPE